MGLGTSGKKACRPDDHIETQQRCISLGCRHGDNRRLDATPAWEYDDAGIRANAASRGSGFAGNRPRRFHTDARAADRLGDLYRNAARVGDAVSFKDHSPEKNIGVAVLRHARCNTIAPILTPYCGKRHRGQTGKIPMPSHDRNNRQHPSDKKEFSHRHGRAFRVLMRLWNRHTAARLAGTECEDNYAGCPHASQKPKSGLCSEK